MFLLCSVLLLLLVNGDNAEVQVEESVSLRAFKSSCNPEDTSIFQRLFDAHDIENHGYTKEVVTKTITAADHEPIRRMVLIFHKKTACNRSSEVEGEMDYFFEGLLSFELIERLALTMESRHYDQIPLCDIGVEVHFESSKPQHKSRRRGGLKLFLFRSRNRLPINSQPLKRDVGSAALDSKLEYSCSGISLTIVTGVPYDLRKET